MVSQKQGAPIDIFAIRDKHAALAGCEGLRAVKTEHANVAKTTCAFPLVFCPYRLRGVFDYRDIISLSYGQDFVHVWHVAVEVDRNYRFRPARKAILEGSR